MAAGCATPGERLAIEVHELDQVALVAACSKGQRDENPDLLGCFEWSAGVCHVYMLPRWVRQQREDGGLEGYHRTLGHELDHCRRGYFHGAKGGVYLPAPPWRLL